MLPAVAVVMLISGLAGLDFAEFIEELSEATWWLVVLGALIAQLARVSQAVSTLGASPVPLPLGPVYALQLAVSYVNIAIPTSAARIAVNIRFFQRHGVAPAPALTAGALDGFAGFVVQAILLVVLVLLTPASLDLSLDSAVSGAGSLLLVAIVIAAAAFGVVAAVGRWRRFVVGWIRRLGKEAFAAVRGLRSPRRLGLLIGGSLATELIFATGARNVRPRPRLLGGSRRAAAHQHQRRTARRADAGAGRRRSRRGRPDVRPRAGRHAGGASPSRPC